MAEPLLKRTFSRLRGKDRSRRKTDPKLSSEETLLMLLLITAALYLVRVCTSVCERCYRGVMFSLNILFI